MSRGVELRVRPVVDDAELSKLHGQAFGACTTFVQSWAARLERHSLSWVGAFEGEALVGFVHLCWDGGAHAFLLDTVVRPTHQRRGIGRDLVRSASDEAATAGCQWLHVDYEPHLQAFYRDACGFAPTDAGLVRLTPPGSALPDSGPAALRTRPMTEAEFDAYRERIVPEYAAENVRAGNWSQDEALTQSTREMVERLFSGLRDSDIRDASHNSSRHTRRCGQRRRRGGPRIRGVRRRG